MNRMLMLAGCGMSLAVAVLAFAQADAPKKLLEYVDTATTELKPKQQKILDQLKGEDTALTVKVVRLDNSALESSSLEFKLPDGNTCQVTNGRKTPMKDDMFRYTGEVAWPGRDLPPREMNLTTNDGNSIGSFQFDTSAYNIRPIGDGLHVIIQRNPKVFETKPEEPMEGVRRIEQEASGKLQPANNPQAEAAPPKVKVMVLWTPAVNAHHPEGMPLFIDHVLTITNQAYINSMIPVTLELAHAEEVDYEESGSVEADVEHLSNPSDQSIDGIHTLRDTHKADLVVMLIERADAFGMADAILADASTAFAVVDDEVADWYFTFAHECGHLFGCRHNPEADPTSMPFAYGHCYCNAPKQWRTIMSYDCTGSSTRIGLWSNPSLKHPPGNGGDPAGTTALHDNARVIRETAATIAGFR